MGPMCQCLNLLLSTMNVLYLVQKVKFQIVHQVCRAGLLAAYFKMQNFPHTPPPPPPSPPILIPRAF